MDTFEQRFPLPEMHHLAELAESASDEGMLLDKVAQYAIHWTERYPDEFLTLLEQMLARDWKEQETISQLTFRRAVVIQHCNRYSEAVQIYGELLNRGDISQRLRAEALNARAMCQRLTGDLQGACQGYQISLLLWELLGDRSGQGQTHLNLGIVYNQLKQSSRAEIHLQSACQIFHDSGLMDWEFTAEEELGNFYRNAGRLSDALACFERQIGIDSRNGLVTHPARALVNRGEILFLQERLSEAQNDFEKALESSDGDLVEVDAAILLGLTYYVSGFDDKVLQIFEHALNLAGRLNHPESLAKAYYYLGEQLVQAGQNLPALEHFEAAVQELEAIHSRQDITVTKIDLLGGWQQIYERLVLHCQKMGRLDRAFTWAERARFFAYQEFLQASGETSNRKPVSEEGISIRNLARKLPQGSLAFFFFTTGVHTSEMHLLRSIPQNRRLRQFMLVEPHTLRFGLQHLDSDAESYEIDIYDCDLDPNLLAQANHRGVEQEDFLQPEKVNLLGDRLLSGVVLDAAQRWYLALHGPLHRISPAAMLAERSSAEIELVYMPDAAHLQAHFVEQQDEKEIQLDNLLAVAHASPQDAAALRYASQEAQMAAAALDGIAWIDARPKKDALRKSASQVRRLHFACHAWIDHVQPFESYLETGAGERLTAREVLSNWKLKADLVVLSACRTNANRVLRDDEPYGLVRAFLTAGAKAVMFSQWEMDDFAVCLMMGKFYEEVRRASGENLASILWRTQLWLRNLSLEDVIKQAVDMSIPDHVSATPVGDKPFSHPRFWAGFVLVGDV